MISDDTSKNCCKKCKVIKQYYDNKKIKTIYYKCCNLKIHFCKECGSTRIVWDNLDIVCLSCGLVHEQITFDSESDEREDIPIPF